MEKTFHLNILTPYGHYFEGEVEFLEVRSEKYNLGILPGHAPLISTLEVGKMILRSHGENEIYAIGGGIINVEKEKVTLVLDSIESRDEIDLDRAKEAKKRAEERLNISKEDDAIDVNRAKLALLKAINRINIISKD